MKLQDKLVPKTQTSDLSKSLALAFQRTSTEPFDISLMVNDIKTEFKDMSEDSVYTAIRNGSLGAYGYTYKLTTQVVCIWIREYRKEENIKRQKFG